MINDNENEAENEKKIAQIQHKQTYAETWRQIYTYTKYKIQLSIMMDACIKQHQSKI